MDILKISANHYSNLTVSQSLQDTEVATLAAVSQPYLAGELSFLIIFIGSLITVIVRAGT